MRENKRKAKDNVTRSSDEQEQQPKIWTTERNGTTQRRVVSLDRVLELAEHLEYRRLAKSTPLYKCMCMQ